MTNYPFAPMIPAQVASTAPYTYSDAATFLEILQDFRDRLNQVIQTENTNSAAYSGWYDSANAQLNAAMEQLTSMTAGYTDQLTKMQQLDDATQGKLKDSLASVQKALDDAAAANKAASTLADQYTQAITAAMHVNDALAQRVSTNETALAHKVNTNEFAFDVRDFGAVGDGQTNDTAAFVAALKAADSVSTGGATVFAGPGTYLLDSFTIPGNVTLQGANIVTITAAPTQFKFSKATGTFITLGSGNANIVGVQLNGPGSSSDSTAISMTATSANSLRDVSCVSWGTGAYCEQIWYLNMYNFGTFHCATGIMLNYCYNASLYNYRCHGVRDDGKTYSDYGVVLRAKSCVSIHGGSFEYVGHCIEQSAGTHAYVTGVYFENFHSGFYNGDRLASATAIGNFVYMPGAGDAWFDWSVAGANDRIVSFGNHFKGGDPNASPAPVAYRFPAQGTGFSTRAILLGDGWMQVTGGDYRTDANTAGLFTGDVYGSNNKNVGPGDDGVYGVMDWSGSILATGVVATYASDSRFNVSGNRAAPYKGGMMFDTKLGKPIWWNGTKWVDATGAGV